MKPEKIHDTSSTIETQQSDPEEPNEQIKEEPNYSESFLSSESNSPVIVKNGIDASRAGSTVCRSQISEKYTETETWVFCHLFLRKFNAFFSGKIQLSQHHLLILIAIWTKCILKKESNYIRLKSRLNIKRKYIACFAELFLCCAIRITIFRRTKAKAWSDFLAASALEIMYSGMQVNSIFCLIFFISWLPSESCWCLWPWKYFGFY